MKKLLLIATIALTTLAACERDNALLPGGTTEKAEQALLEKYPEATDILWQNKNGYIVASFSHTLARATNTTTLSAWFDAVGRWYMTETDLLFEQLPDAVKTSFAATAYAQWKIEEVDKIEREGTEIIYVIEVKDATGIEKNLFYTPDGVLTKELTDVDDDYDYEDFIPAGQTTTIESYISKNFPSARIIEVDREGTHIEVEILDGKIKRDLLFDSNSQWVHTKTELRVSEVPSSIMKVLNNSVYGSYRVDDVDQYITLNSDYFRFELSSRHGDINIRITKEGVLTEIGLTPEEDDYVGGLNSACSTFITTKYPGARIIEQENSNGYLEVDIVHEAKAKTVRFNAANKWIDTHWDINLTLMPEDVKNAINASNYASYRIDDVEFFQTATTEYYEVELENGALEAKLRILANGTIL